MQKGTKVLLMLVTSSLLRQYLIVPTIDYLKTLIIEESSVYLSGRKMFIIGLIVVIVAWKCLINCCIEIKTH